MVKVEAAKIRSEFGESSRQDQPCHTGRSHRKTTEDEWRFGPVTYRDRLKRLKDSEVCFDADLGGKNAVDAMH